MTTQTEKIRQRNDLARSTFFGITIMLTEGVRCLPTADHEAVITKVREFDAFTPDNDPHGEHDFGAFEHGDSKYFWKIDYYAPDMEHGSEDPADPAKTKRVLTIMRADEY